MRVLVLAGLVLSLSAGSAHAQSLGDVARREQEKKKEKPASAAPTYTEADLKAAREKGKGSYTQLPGPAPVSPSPSPAAATGGEPDRALLERQWRARFAEARAHVAEADARSYEERLEIVFVNGMPVQQTVRVKVESEELKAARKALIDLEDELRRAGGLPGWARE